MKFNDEVPLPRPKTLKIIGSSILSAISIFALVKGALLVAVMGFLLAAGLWCLPKRYFPD